MRALLSKVAFLSLCTVGCAVGLMTGVTQLVMAQTTSPTPTSPIPTSPTPSAPTPSQTVIRYPIPNSTFPISEAVEIAPGATLVYLSGQVPPVVDPDADPRAIAAFGDTRTQTVNVLRRIEGILENLGLTMGDVVKMQVFLVGDPENGGNMDFAGFMEGYQEFFGTEAQPNLPVRSTMQIAGLVNPGWLVEIEVEAVRPTQSGE